MGTPRTLGRAWFILPVLAALLGVGGCAPALRAPTSTPTPAPLAAPWTPGQLEVHIIDVDHGDAYCTRIVTNCDAYGDIMMTSRDGKTYAIEGKSYTSK